MSARSWTAIGDRAFTYSKQQTDFVPALADWVECQAITRTSVGCDKATLMSALKIGTWDPPKDDIDISHDQLAEEVFGELAQRSTDYNGHGYPFKCNEAGRSIVFEDSSPWPYVFLLGLSYTNPKVRPPKQGIATGGHILESLAWVGMQRLVGSPTADLVDSAHCHHLGRPSVSSLPAYFYKKVDIIAKQFKEGSEYKPQAHNHYQRSGDGGVDILLRRGFRDSRGAQFLLFGACAGGEDWRTTKSYECDPDKWLKKHFKGGFRGPKGMARCYFVSRQIAIDDWEDTATAAGMIVDRCRLSSLAHGSQSPYLGVARQWTEAFFGQAF